MCLCRCNRKACTTTLSTTYSAWAHQCHAECVSIMSEYTGTSWNIKVGIFKQMIQRASCATCCHPVRLLLPWATDRVICLEAAKRFFGNTLFRLKLPTQQLAPPVAVWWHGWYKPPWVRNWIEGSTQTSFSDAMAAIEALSLHVHCAAI